MGNLFISFLIAIGGAIVVVSLSKVYDLEFYTSKMLPLVPILYAMIYEVLERSRGGKVKERQALHEREGAKAADETPIIQGVTASRVLMGIAVSFGIKFTIEISLVFLFLSYTGQTFTQVYGVFGIETIGAFLRGDHPWLSGYLGVYMLALIALITCFGTGLWIGYTTRGKAILEGVITGAAITFITSMTNMLTLYQKFEQVTVRLAESMGYVMHAGFMIVVGLQVLLYGLWSGIVQMGREERAERGPGRKPKKS